MQPLLTREHYSSEKIFAAECAAIFRRVWMLAAIRPMVANHLDFRTLELAGIPLIIQNFHGRIRAFANICRHRLGRIHMDEFGSRPLVCPYHNWSYGEDGRLRSLPRNDTMFQFSSEQIAQIRLAEFATEVVGGLIFVNLGDHPLPIGEQFDPGLLELLAQATGTMDDTYIYTRYPAGFNWKTGIENIRDPLHVQCLHRQTFPDHIDASGTLEGFPQVRHDDREWRSVPLPQATTLADVPITEAGFQAWHSLVHNLDSAGFYRGISLFPNVNLMIVAGTSFSVQIYNPLSAGRTEMQMAVALTRPVKPFPHKAVVLWEHLRSDMRVLAQDIDCLEALQGNFPVAQYDVTHGAYEAAILDFHSAYLELLRTPSSR